MHFNQSINETRPAKATIVLEDSRKLWL